MSVSVSLSSPSLPLLAAAGRAVVGGSLSAEEEEEADLCAGFVIQKRWEECSVSDPDPYWIRIQKRENQPQ
jgi:hypothetical protein